MKLLPAAVAAVFLTVPSLALPGPSLPTSDGADRKTLDAAGWSPGAILGAPDPASEDFTAPPELESPLAEEIAEDSNPTVEVPEQFLSAYFAERPLTFLVDPQNLLSPVDAQARLGFLNDHAADSSIDLFVYVLGGDQEIPSEVREEEVPERFFAAGRPAVVVCYYLGAPQRSVVHLSPSLSGSIPLAEQHRALESSVMQALEKIKPAEQLDRFLVQMSIRLYWLERTILGEPATGAPPALTENVAAAKNRVDAQSEKFLRVQALAAKAAMPAAFLLGALMIACAFNRWLRVRARYFFPEFDVEPRLGGAHAAGVGAVISFASASVPPASQRDQVPDYLRRA